MTDVAAERTAGSSALCDIVEELNPIKEIRPPAAQRL